MENNAEAGIIIYGAGLRGKNSYEFIKKLNKKNIVVAFCDQKYNEIKNIDDKQVVSFEEACKYNVPFMVSPTDKNTRMEIIDKIEKSGHKWFNVDDISEVIGVDKVIFNREFCAFFHEDGMNGYFEAAEQKDSLDVFWGKKSMFVKMFNKLDLTSVIELACGRGRHVPEYAYKAKEVTLVDILEKNIEKCKERFKDYKNIRYYCNNGYNLEKLESNHYTALFCYDAMVHFEMMDIYEYLKDIHRVLAPGGMALIHHSNNTSDYKASFVNAPHGRSFMSKDIFAYLAYRCGFQIVEQREIDWEIENLDCISLICKNI